MSSFEFFPIRNHLLKRHPGESRGPGVVPTKAGNRIEEMDPGFRLEPWIPASAGMTKFTEFYLFRVSPILDHGKGVTALNAGNY